jgi:peptide/nickel transport system substrate-binding protein
MVWALPSKPTTLDPARMEADLAAEQVTAQVYDRLIQFRPGTADLAPGIAANWTSDAEGRTFTFTLHDGIRFQDGTKLDAVAVAWNFQRWMDPKHPAHNGEFRAWRDYFGGFVGEVDQQGRAINLVSRVEALDPLTVRVVLHAPFAPFLYHLAMLPFGFASPAAVTAQGKAYGSDGEHLPVGSGPFRVVSWSGDGTVALTAFADYWAGRPSVPGLWFVVIPDPAQRAAAVAAGRAHGADLAPTTPITGNLKAPTVQVLARPARANAWLMLNLSREPLGDVRVRRAISMAIDRARLALDHFGSLAVPASQLLPPGFMGYDDSIKPSVYDPAAAKALLAEAGVASGLKLNIWVANSPRGFLPDPAGTGDAVVTMLKEVGIDASVRSENLRQFLLDRDRGRFTAWITGWEAQSVDPDNFWFWHFGAGRAAAEGQYDKPDLAAALLKAQRTVGAQQREEIYLAAAKTVAGDEPRLFLAYTRPLVLISDRLRNYRPSPMGFDSFREVSLAPSAGGVPLATLSSPLTPVATSATTAPVTPTLTVSATSPAVSSTGTAPPVSPGATK